MIEFKEVTYVGDEYSTSFKPYFVQLPPEERQKILLATHKKIRELKEDLSYRKYMEKKESLAEHTDVNWPSNIRNLFENVLSVYTQPSMSYGAITFDGIIEKLSHYLMSERNQRTEEFKTLLWPKAQNEQDEEKLICYFFCQCAYKWKEDIIKVKAALQENPSLTFEDLNKILYFVDSF